MNRLPIAVILIATMLCLASGCSKLEDPVQKATTPVEGNGAVATGLEAGDQNNAGGGVTVGQTEGARIDTYLGEVGLASVQINKAAKTLTAEIKAYWSGDTQQLYIFRIAGNTASDRLYGFRVSLSSPEHMLLWEYVFEIDSLAKVGYVTERSSDDYLTIILRDGDEDRIETYIDSKGQAHEYRYSMEISRKIRSNTPFTLEESSIMDALSRKFQLGYDAHGSLNDNRYGLLVTELCTRSDFIELLCPQGVPNSPANKLDPYSNPHDLCILASTCAALKCLEGLVANPICAGCMGVSIGCLIGDWYDAWFGD